MDDLTIANVSEFPPCDINNGHGDAKYDGKTINGQWAYMCQACFDNYGLGLGLGVGQKLVLRGSDNG